MALRVEDAEVVGVGGGKEEEEEEEEGVGSGHGSRWRWDGDKLVGFHGRAHLKTLGDADSLSSWIFALILLAQLQNMGVMDIQNCI